ncbi:peptidoglycan DD-metalloendopeptidase family protein [candidate division KSB1 bacterium]|nr:peptidoglycan DD-metalloendopeptidase family protein [candidate division KSB1 bacterium]
MIRNFISKILLLLILIGWVSTSESQNLTEIRQDILRLERELQSKQSEEQDLLRLVEDLDHEIGLRKKLLTSLEAEVQTKAREITRAERDLIEAAKRYDKRKDLIAQRITTLYKKGRVGDVEMLLSVRNLNQMLIWMQYQKRIIEQDQRNLEAILKKKQEIETLQCKLDREIIAKRDLLDETQRETVKIELKKVAQRGPLARVKQEESTISRRLEDQKRIKAVIEKQILEEESKPKTSVQELDEKKFASQKGKLNWPVSGKVIQKYGRQKNPITKTWWENNGIDVTAASGVEVLNVAVGRVKYVDWQRSMGNLVLIDHGGYYTVYGHLDVVDVDIGQDLFEGTSIGRLGEPDSLYGSILHFELWNGKDHVNPEHWLRK